MKRSLTWKLEVQESGYLQVVQKLKIGIQTFCVVWNYIGKRDVNIAWWDSWRVWEELPSNRQLHLEFVIWILFVQAASKLELSSWGWTMIGSDIYLLSFIFNVDSYAEATLCSRGSAEVNDGTSKHTTKHMLPIAAFFWNLTKLRKNLAPRWYNINVAQRIVYPHHQKHFWKVTNLKLASKLRSLLLLRFGKNLQFKMRRALLSSISHKHNQANRKSIQKFNAGYLQSAVIISNFNSYSQLLLQSVRHLFCSFCSGCARMAFLEHELHADSETVGRGSCPEIELPVFEQKHYLADLVRTWTVFRWSGVVCSWNGAVNSSHDFCLKRLGGSSVTDRLCKMR